MENKEAILFNLSNIIHSEIDNTTRKNVCFRENMLVGKLPSEGNEIPSTVGGMCLDVQPALDNKFIIYVSTKFDIIDINGNSATGGSKITAWLDSDCHTIEEKRIEYLTGDEGVKQKLYIGMQKSKFNVRQQLKTKNSCDSRSLDYYLPTVSQLICEGANFVIMRIIALTRYIGKFEMSTLYINGDLCRNLYECSGAERAFVNFKKIMICRIRRMIIEECGIVHECLTILTSTGHIIKQEWKGCIYILQMNPLQDPDLITATGCDARISTGAPWQDDIQLTSEYLDRHKLCEYKIKNYRKNESYLDDLLADYVKSLLQHKPTKVLEFTSQFFLRYASICKK